jgi:hypothetical protein
VGSSASTKATDAGSRVEQNAKSLFEQHNKTREVQNAHSVPPGKAAVVPNEESQSEHHVQDFRDVGESTQQVLDKQHKGSFTVTSMSLDSRLPRPGAVAMAPSNVNAGEDEPFSNNASQQKQDARVKSRASRRSDGALGKGGSISSTSGKKNLSAVDDIHDNGLDELARRREERASVRASRRVVRSEMKELTDDEASKGLESAAIEPTKYLQEKVRVHNTSGADSSISSRPLFANMSEEQRQHTYDRKIAQMELEHREQLSRQANTTQKANGYTKNSSVTAAIVTTQGSSNITEEERQSCVEANFASVSQGHATDLVKSGSNLGSLIHDNVVLSNTPLCERIGEPAQHEWTKDASQHNGSKLQYSDSLKPSSRSNQQDLTPSERDRSYTALRGIGAAPDVEKGTFQEIRDDKLAVAVAINEDDVEGELEKLVSVYAIEYDPNSKPPLYKNRRFRIYGLGGCCLICGLLIVLVSISVKNNIARGGKGSDAIKYVFLTSTPTVSPTDIPTNARENLYRKFLAEEVSPLVFEPGSPHFMASEWILNEDPQQMEIDNPRLLQRYVVRLGKTSSERELTNLLLLSDSYLHSGIFIPVEWDQDHGYRAIPQVQGKMTLALLKSSVEIKITSIIRIFQIVSDGCQARMSVIGGEYCVDLDQS